MVTNLPVLTGTILSKEATQAFIRYTMPGMLEEGFSGRKIKTVYRNLGYKFTDSWFWDTRRDVLGIEKAAHTISFVSATATPDTSKFAVPKWKLETEFMYTGTYKEIDLDTFVITEKGWSWKTNFVGSREDIERQMLIDANKKYPNIDVYKSDMSVRKAFQSG